MKLLKARTVIPALFMTGAAAVPVVTVAEMLSHVSTSTPSGTFSTASNPPPTSPPAATTTPLPTSTAQASSSPKAGGASVHKTKPTATATATAKPTATSTPVQTTRTIAGPTIYDRWGPVQATITVKGGKITNVQISTPTDPHSQEINAQAVPMLVSETLQAQSANASYISGATDTSDAYVQSLQSAISTARQQGVLK